MNSAFIVLLLLRCLFVISYTDLEFLKDFFADKKVTVSVNSCWKNDKSQVFMKDISLSSNPIPVAMYENRKKNSLKQWSYRNYLVLDLRSCLKSEQLLQKLISSNVFVYSVKFLLLISESEVEKLAEKLSYAPILPNSEIVIAGFEQESVFLRQPYKVDVNREIIWENYGNWSMDGGLYEIYSNTTATGRRSNLRGANLNVVIVTYDNDTWNHLTDYRDPGVDTFTKQDYAAMQCVLEQLNVNFSLYGVDSYGYVDPITGRFTGLIYEVQDGKADIAGVSAFFTEERFEAVDLIKMGNPLAIRFIVKKPSTSYIKNIFFITFSRDVWIACLIILIIFAILVKIILNWEAANKKKVKQQKYTAADVGLIALEALCQQGTTTEPQSFSGRIIALISFGAFMFIYVSYSAYIVVLLQSTTTINNIQELVETRLKAGGCERHYMRNYFESAKKGPLKELYEKKIYPDKYFPLDVGMRKVQDGNFAFHVLLQEAYQYILNNFTNYEICGLQLLPGYIEENKGYIAIPKQSAYKDIFKVALLRVDEYGLQRRTNLRIIMKPVCFSQSATFKSLEIYDCMQLFWMWFSGSLLAFIIFCAEKLIQLLKYKNTTINNTSNH